MENQVEHVGGPGVTSTRPVFLGILGIARAVRVAVNCGDGDNWVAYLICPSRHLVRMQAKRAAKRDSDRMAWMARLRHDNPGMYSTTRYVAHVLSLVSSPMRMRAAA